MILKSVLYVVRVMYIMLCLAIRGAIEVPEIPTLWTLFSILALDEWSAILYMPIIYICCMEGAPWSNRVVLRVYWVYCGPIQE